MHQEIGGQAHRTLADLLRSAGYTPKSVGSQVMHCQTAACRNKILQAHDAEFAIDVGTWLGGSSYELTLRVAPSTGPVSKSTAQLFYIKELRQVLDGLLTNALLKLTGQEVVASNTGTGADTGANTGAGSGADTGAAPIAGPIALGSAGLVLGAVGVGMLVAGDKCETANELGGSCLQSERRFKKGASGGVLAIGVAAVGGAVLWYALKRRKQKAEHPPVDVAFDRNSITLSIRKVY